MSKKELLQTVPIFPLTGVVLLPGGQLPLNIFEPRYLNMVDDALAEDRLIGMVQPCDHKDNKPCCEGLYSTGGLGKITTFHETEDGRYLITLTGTSRFDISREINTARGYRRAEIKVSSYEDDVNIREMVKDVDWDPMCHKLQAYFEMHRMTCDWEMVKETPKSQLLTMLSMICPFDPSEKQALLEAQTPQDRFDLFCKIIDISLQTETGGEAIKH